MRALGKVNCFKYWYALYKIPLLVPVKNGLQAFNNTQQFIHFGRGVASLAVLWGLCADRRSLSAELCGTNAGAATGDL